MQSPTQKLKEKLDTRFSVKLPNGTYVSIDYNPYENSIGLATQYHNYSSANHRMFPLTCFKGSAPIKDVEPKGSVLLSTKLLSIAKATVLQKNDTILFFHENQQNPIDFITREAQTTSTIRDIEMWKSTEGNLVATVFFEKGLRKYMIFKGESLDVDRIEDGTDDK